MKLEIYVDPYACECRRSEGGTIARVLCLKHKMVLEEAQKQYNQRVIECEDSLMETNEYGKYCGLCRMKFTMEDTRHRRTKRHIALVSGRLGASPNELYRTGRGLRVYVGAKTLKDVRRYNNNVSESVHGLKGRPMVYMHVRR